MSLLSVSHLRKQYSSTVAVDDVSFQIEKNEIVGLLGPNGAGKTTTINMILGVLTPTSGSIMIDGIDLLQHRSQVLQQTNFAAVYASLPGNMTVIQNLRIFGLLYAVPQLEVRIKEVMEQCHLEKFRHTKCGLLSSGEQTRVSLAKAILNRPKLLLLDEPTASLDPATAQQLRQFIQSYARNGDAALLWTSHNMFEVESMCDRVLFLSHGKVLHEGNPKTLVSEHGKKNLEDFFLSLAHES